MGRRDKESRHRQRQGDKERDRETGRDQERYRQPETQRQRETKTERERQRQRDRMNTGETEPGRSHRLFVKPTVEVTSHHSALFYWLEASRKVHSHRGAGIT